MVNTWWKRNEKIRKTPREWKEMPTRSAKMKRCGSDQTRSVRKMWRVGRKMTCTEPQLRRVERRWVVGGGETYYKTHGREL